MARYVVLPVSQEPEDALDVSLEAIRTVYPDWEAAPADPVGIVLRGNAVMVADMVAVVSRVSEELFRFFGRGLAGVAPMEALPATGVVRFTAQDANGPYVVPDGYEVQAASSLGEPIGFATVGQGIVPNGATFVDLPVEALDDGTEYNGVTGDVELSDSDFRPYLTDATLIGTTSGGTDREPDADFLDRLATELQLLTPRPIKAADFAVLARRYGAYRATAIDGYNPTTGTSGNLATVTVAMMDAAGQPLGATLRDAIGAQLEALREVGWEVFTINPTVTAVAVAYTGQTYQDADPVATKAQADAQIAQVLSGINWGYRTDSGDSREWTNETKVRWGDVYRAIQGVPGMRYVTALSIAGAGQGNDYTLPGVAPLPSPGTISGTVTSS